MKKIKQNTAQQFQSKKAIEIIYKYFHINYREIKSNAKFNSVEEKISYHFDSYHIHYRKVKLTHHWHRDATGPMLCVSKENNELVALIPNRNGRGYHYRNPKNNLVRFMKTIDEKLFSEDAYLLYRPFKDGPLHFKDILRFMLNSVTRFELIGYAILVIVSTLFGLILPNLTRWIFNEIAINSDISIVSTLAVFITGYVVVSLLFVSYKLFIANHLIIKIRVSLEAAAMERIISLPTSFFKRYSAGDLANRFSYLNVVCDVIVTSIGVTTISFIFALIYVVQIFFFATILAVVSIITILLMVGFNIAVIYFAERNIRNRITFETKESGMSYAMISGIEKIKIAGAEKRMYNRWANLYKKCVNLTYNPPFIIKIRGFINSLISLSGTAIVYVVAIYLHINVADFYAFNTIYAMVTATILAFNTTSIDIAQIRPYYEIASPLLKTLSETQKGQNYITTLNGDVNISHLSFRYEKDEPYILNDLSLHIKPGEEVAIVGETGAGKSTLIRLLLGFEKPLKGTIYYDQNDIRDIELKSLRRLIGTVMQDTRLFSGDVYSNIVIGAPWKTTKDAWKAAEIAAFDSDIKAMPMGMKTLLQEGSGGISGGQKQRLAIARAVVNNPKILIFDEATSALDNITQKKVSDAIKELKCTRIVIAHRLSTVIHANQIYVLKNGSIIEHGTYQELSKKKNSEFTKLMSRQQL
ncbi:MAG: ATP-binding cassette domain-containing protein [Bacilli bacterium]|nr:ATP-binding cassette domain-containing protein [Bacilli bacterium]